MKIKSLLIGMLACTALVGCTDDVIEENSMNPMADKTPAYLSISFGVNTSNSRSTADDANNLGDKDGSAEDSGHKNLGTETEKKVSTALVVVAPESGNTAHAQLYVIADGASVDDLTATDKVDFKVVGQNYNLKEPIKLTAGKYKVLVVANPPSTLTTSQNLGQAVTDIATVNKLYESITTGSYALTENASSFVGELATDKGITMSNKEEVAVSLKANEVTTATVKIERTISKITFRNKQGGNVYPIDVYVGRVDAETVTFTKDGETNPTTLNVAKTGDLDIYVEIQPSTKIYYVKEGDTYVVKNDLTPDQINAIKYVYDESKATKQTWKVSIEEYALVNLAKDVNYVRHTTSGSLSIPFGELDGNNFLWTPYWANGGINDITFDANGNFAEPTTQATLQTWFAQTLKEVSDESKAGEEATTNFYKPIPKDVEEDNTVSGTGKENHTTSESLVNIGSHLAYCLENSTDIEHQTHGLSTGISFKAKIYKEDGTTPVGRLYRFGNHLFESIQDIVTAFGEAAVGQDIVKLANGTTTESPETLAAAGISKYDGNTCYYYTTEIKHFDNGNPNELGNMEFAIMRNNIYSLAITKVSKIGDPFVDPTPSIPNEHPEAALEVEAEIIPWIVRYHDIEF